MYYSKQHKQKKNINFVYKWSLIIGSVLIAAALPLSFILPVSVSFENGLIENLQVVSLIVGGIYNITLIGKSTDYQIADFHLWCTVLMFFMAFRELSWGRIFYPIGFEATGPVFVDMSNFEYRIEVHILMAAFILFLLVFMLRNLPLQRMLRCRLPFMIIFAMAVAMAFSYIGDHGMVVGKLQGQIVEEFSELAFYTLIPALCIYYHRELSKI